MSGVRKPPKGRNHMSGLSRGTNACGSHATRPASMAFHKHPSRMHKRPNEADCCPKAGGISSKSHRTCVPRNHGDLACTLRDAECHWTNHTQNLVLVRIFAYASQVWLCHASLRSQTASSVVTARRTDLGKLSALPRLRLSLTYTMVWQCQQTASAPSRNVFLA